MIFLIKVCQSLGKIQNRNPAFSFWSMKLKIGTCMKRRSLHLGAEKAKKKKNIFIAVWSRVGQNTTKIHFNRKYKSFRNQNTKCFSSLKNSKYKIHVFLEYISNTKYIFIF